MINTKLCMRRAAAFLLALAIIISASLCMSMNVALARTFDDYQAHPPIHVSAGASSSPKGLAPAQVKAAYHLPATSGAGTIVIIDAYDNALVEKDLAAFDKQFSLVSCTSKNGCLEIHPMNTGMKSDSGWALETALDVEWAHAVAPKAKILLVEAASAGGSNLMKAVDYARGRSDVVAVSMSWGGDEFTGETVLDAHFNATHPIAFFASSGDDGAGASWPAVAPNVIAVGGTSLALDSSGKLSSEKAWTGSGGGVSAYEDEPSYQKTYSIPRAGGKRAIPDVSYAADPVHGFSVYQGGAWYVIGGTSAGAPQWAGIASLSFKAKNAITPSELYIDKSGTKNAGYFRDIVSGKNGTCAYYCTARARYDYVTGLGSPLTYKF